MQILDEESVLHVVEDRHMMGDPDERLAELLTLQVLKDLTLSVGIERRGGFVKEEDGAWLQQGSGDGNALCLAFGETAALLATDGVESLRQIVDEEGTGTLQGIVHLGIGGIELTQLEIVADGAGEEAVALRDVA